MSYVGSTLLVWYIVCSCPDEQGVGSVCVMYSILWDLLG